MEVINLIKKLKDETVLKYLDEIKFSNNDIDDSSNDFAIYDSMIHHLVNGDFDSIYENELLDKKDSYYKEQILGLVSKYNGICFPDNNCDNWLHNIDYLDVDAYELSVYKVINSYNFLVDIAINCGEKGLQRLNLLIKPLSGTKNSIIESLRINYKDDEIIKKLNSTLSDETIIGDFLDKIK